MGCCRVALIERRMGSLVEIVDVDVDVVLLEFCVSLVFSTTFGVIGWRVVEVVVLLVVVCSWFRLVLGSCHGG